MRVWDKEGAKGDSPEEEGMLGRDLSRSGLGVCDQRQKEGKGTLRRHEEWGLWVMCTRLVE